MNVEPPRIATLSGRDPFPGCESDRDAPAPLNVHTGQRLDEWIIPHDECLRLGLATAPRELVRHAKCKVRTQIHVRMAETLAVSPRFYRELFCAKCRTYRPIAEFNWTEIDGSEGPTVGT